MLSDLELKICRPWALTLLIVWLVLYGISSWREPGKGIRVWANDSLTRGGIFLRGLMVWHIMFFLMEGHQFHRPGSRATYYLAFVLYAASAWNLKARPELAVPGFLIAVASGFIAWVSVGIRWN